MYVYRHRDGRVGTGPGTWFAIKDALGAEAGPLVERSDTEMWTYKVIQLDDVGMEKMTSVRQMPFVVDGEEIGMFHEVNDGPQKRQASTGIITQADVDLMNQLVAKMEASAKASGRSWTSVDDLPKNERDLYRSIKAKFDKALEEDFQMHGQHGIDDEEMGRLASTKTAGKNDETVDNRLSEDRKDKGQEPLNTTLEVGVKSDRKDDVDQTYQSIEKNLRDKKSSGPNTNADGLVEKRLNEAKTTLYPHRNEEAWARTGQKRPINALPEELGKASEEKKRERWSKANKAGEKRALDKDIGKQLDLPKTKIEQKTAFNLHDKRVAKLKPYEGYLTYRSSKAGSWSDKFASVREIDSKMQEIMSSGETSRLNQDKIDALKFRKTQLLGLSKSAFVDSKKMDHSEYQKRLRTKSDDELKYIIKDAREAIEANPENPNNGYYQDEISYASMELKRRGQS